MLLRFRKPLNVERRIEEAGKDDSPKREEVSYRKKQR